MRCSDEDCREAVAALRELYRKCHEEHVDALTVELMRAMERAEVLLARIDAGSEEEG